MELQTAYACLLLFYSRLKIFQKSLFSGTPHKFERWKAEHQENRHHCCARKLIPHAERLGTAVYGLKTYFSLYKCKAQLQ